MPSTYLPRIPAPATLPWKGLTAMGVLVVAMLVSGHAALTQYQANTHVYWADWQQRQPRADARQNACALNLWRTPHRDQWQRWLGQIPQGERLLWQARAWKACPPTLSRDYFP